MPEFTPISALIGGTLIGLAACLLLWLNGRIAGVTGIVKRVWPPRAGDVAWRLMFALGLLIGAGAYVAVTGEGASGREAIAPGWLVLAGLLVGVGTSMGNGCTSGHGVCGMARLSKRSIAATLTFLATGLVTVYVMRHVLGVVL